MNVDVLIHSYKTKSSLIDNIPKLCKYLRDNHINVAFLVDKDKSYISKKYNIFGVELYPGCFDDDIIALNICEINGDSFEEKVEYVNENNGIVIIKNPKYFNEKYYNLAGTSRTGILRNIPNPIVGSGAKYYEEIGSGFISIDSLEDLYKYKKIQYMYLNTKYSKFFSRLDNIVKKIKKF
jgi:hypothetical protein